MGGAAASAFEGERLLLAENSRAVSEPAARPVNESADRRRAAPQGGGADVLGGEAGADVLLGAGGDDVLQGDGATLAEALHGGDFLDGGAGEDRLFGQGAMCSFGGGRQESDARVRGQRLARGEPRRLGAVRANAVPRSL